MKIVYEKNMRNSLRNLHKAIQDKNINQVKHHIQAGFNLDNFYNGKAASQVALKGRCFEICRLLFKSGSDVNMRIEDGDTLLHLSFEEPLDVEKISFLLENGADPDVANNFDVTPLQIACLKGDATIAKLLIDRSNYINRCDLKGESALFKCAKKGDTEIVKLLVEKSADLDWTDNEKQTPLMRAVEVNQFEVVKLLVESGCNVNAQDKYRKSPLMLACSLNHLSIVTCLLSHQANIDLCDLKKNTAFTEAVFSLNIEIVDELVSRGCDVNVLAFDLHGTALHHCIVKASIIYGQRKKQLMLFQRLIKIPTIDIEIQDKLGCTPLYHACVNGEEDLAECLLDIGASTDVETFQKETILHACVLGNCVKIISRLISKGLNVDALTLKNQCPLFLAVDRKASPKIIESLIEKECMLNYVEKDGNLTPLHAAVIKKYPEAVRMLIQAGCDVNIPNKAGNSALWSACEQNDEEIVCMLLKCSNIEIEVGPSALHISIRKRNVRIVKMLLRERVDLNRLSGDFKSPLLLATEQESVPMVALLIKHGANPSAHHRLNRFTSGCCFIHKDTHPHMELEPLFIALQNDCIKSSTLIVIATHHYPLRELTTLRDILFRTSYIRDAKISEKSIVQFAHFFSRLLSTPRSLKESCRGLVRMVLGQYPEEGISKLNVPDSIKNYLRFSNIDALLPK